jgi:hypothetical protein
MSISLTSLLFGQLSSGSETKSQLKFLTVLDSRSQGVKTLPGADMVGSGLIQVLSWSIELNRDSSFLHNRGLDYFLDILVDFKSDALVDLILSSLASLAGLNRFVATTESSHI